MTPFTTILTHPGGAHKDELLACAVLLAVSPAPIVRREPTAADLDDPAVAVIDVGQRHEPALNNFDHHQLPADHPPTCSLTLVLQHLGLYADAREFCDWLEPAEWFDTRGPTRTAKWLGVERELLNKVHSPIDGTLLRRFAQTARLDAGDPLWEILRMTGEDILGYVRGLRARLDFIAARAELWTLPSGDKVLFMPRTEPLPEEPSAGLDRHVASLGPDAGVIALVYPDRRSTGHGLTRYRDHPRVDFNRVAAEPDVHFAHASGFVAKTTATDPARLRELVRLAVA